MLGLVVSIVMIGAGTLGAGKVIGVDFGTLLRNPDVATGVGIAVAGIAIAVGLIMGKTIAALRE